MDFQIRISGPALADFADIVEYAWINFPDTAERFGNAILNHVDLLKSFPYIGSAVRRRAGVRQLIHTPILIRYRVHEDSKIVEILQFRHAARSAG